MAAGAGTRAAGWMMGGGAAIALLGAVLSAVSMLTPLSGLAGGWSGATRGLVLAAGGGLLALGAVIGLVGLTVYVLVPAFSSQERARQDYGSHRVVLACTLLAAVGGNLLAALYFIPAAFLMAPGSPATAGGPELARGLLSPTGIAVAAVSLDTALLIVVYLRIVRPRAIPWAVMGLNLRRLRGRLLLGLAFGVALFAVSGVLESLLAQLGIHQTQSALFQSVTRANPREFGIILLAGAVIAPVAEEIYFRGYVFRAYLDKKGPWQAFLFSAGLFAVVHLNLPALLPIFAMGLLLAFLYYRTGSIVPAIIAHAVNNAAAFTMLYLGLV